MISDEPHSTSGPRDPIAEFKAEQAETQAICALVAAHRDNSNAVIAAAAAQGCPSEVTDLGWWFAARWMVRNPKQEEQPKEVAE